MVHAQSWYNFSTSTYSILATSACNTQPTCQTACGDLGAKLVEIETSAEMTFVNDLLMDELGKNALVWVGIIWSTDVNSK